MSPDADTPSTADPSEVRLPEDPSTVDMSPEEALAPGAGSGAEDAEGAGGAGESMGGEVDPGGGAGDDDGMTGA